MSAHSDDGYDPRLQVAGEGPPLVYVPGLDGTGMLFYRQIPPLARHYRVGTYTLRDAAREMDTLVDDLDAIVGAVSDTAAPVVLVAESFGGALAMTYALAHPERVSALVVLNTFPYFRPQFRLRLAQVGIRSIPWGAMRVVRRLTEHRLHSHHTERAEIAAFHHFTALTTRRGYLNRLRILQSYDVRDQLPRLRPPLLVLAAEEDRLIPSVEQGALIASLAPRASLRVLHGHGHSCFLAYDVDLDAILREWRDELALA